MPPGSRSTLSLMPLPPDRGHLTTEQDQAGHLRLDTLGSLEFIDAMVDESIAAAEAVRGCRDALARFIDELVSRMERGGRLIYLGAGTSGRLGVLDASECPPTFHSDPSQVIGLIAGGDAALRRSSEHREDHRDGAIGELDSLELTSDDMVLGIAAGGTTPWVLGGLEHAATCGCGTALLRCADAGPVEVDHLLQVESGAELLTGSTRLKAGTATKIVLNTITTSAFVRLGKVHGRRMVDLRATNDKLHDRALRILRAYVPALDRSQADELLQNCGGELKTAIASGCGGMTPGEARAALQRAGDRLGPVLDAGSEMSD